jgi:GT2 family glycosyltransferase
LEYTKKTLETINLPESDALLLIDNGSSDGTSEFIEKYQSRNNLFRLKFGQNLGVAGAWNKALDVGFEQMKADVIILLNNDILINPFTIKRIIEDLQMPGVGLVSACDISKKCADEKEFFETSGIVDDKYIEAPQFSCFGINKNCFEKVGYFDEAFYPAYFEDNDYHYRMRLTGLKALCNQGNFYFHYGSRTKQHDTKFGEYIGTCYSVNADYYLQKWGGMQGEEKYKIPFNGFPPKNIKRKTFPEYLAGNK